MSKYICEKCNYKTNYKSQWNNHLGTILHKTGKRKTRTDKKYSDNCPKCEYIASNNTNMKLHILNNHSIKEKRKVGFKYYCECCDFGTFGKTIYNKHIQSKRHKHLEELINEK